jgi:hypothetical protein
MTQKSFLTRELPPATDGNGSRPEVQAIRQRSARGGQSAFASALPGSGRSQSRLYAYWAPHSDRFILRSSPL